MEREREREGERGRGRERDRERERERERWLAISAYLPYSTLLHSSLLVYSFAS